MITNLAKETGQQKEQLGWGLEMTGKLGGGGRVGQNFKRGGGRQYRGGLHKIGG